MTLALAERFWVKVDRCGSDECWPWLAYRDRKGYGRMLVGSRRDGSRTYKLAHRIAYELLVGAVPDGLEIDHLCRNPGCVNPAHLEAVTHRENLLRGESPSALHSRKTHCPKGHPYDEENTYVEPSGRRRCRICERAKTQRRLKARREQ